MKLHHDKHVLLITSTSFASRIIRIITGTSPGATAVREPAGGGAGTAIAWYGTGRFATATTTGVMFAVTTSSTTRVIVHNVRWYLGIKGMVLPGSGFGVEEVAANSPAALAGIQPGHVILRVNGVDLVDQQSFDDVMAQTNGVLQMTILDDQQQQHEIVVRMQRLATVSY